MIIIILYIYTLKTQCSNMLSKRISYILICIKLKACACIFNATYYKQQIDLIRAENPKQTKPISISMYFEVHFLA